MDKLYENIKNRRIALAIQPIPENADFISNSGIFHAWKSGNVASL